MPRSNQENRIGMGWEGCGCPMVVRGTTTEYRYELERLARADDVMLEIGCAAGVTCLKLAKRVRRVIGVDGAAGEVAGAVSNLARPLGRRQRRTADVTFLQLLLKGGTANDHADKAALSSLAAVLHPQTLRDVSLLAVDIGGTAPLDQLLPVLHLLRQECRPRLTVVKSLPLRKLFTAANAGETLAGEIPAAECTAASQDRAGNVGAKAAALTQGSTSTATVHAPSASHSRVPSLQAGWVVACVCSCALLVAGSVVIARRARS